MKAGEFLKHLMTERGFSVPQLAKAIGVSPQAIYNVTGETARPISAKMAKGLSKTLGGSVEFWLRESFPDHVEEQKENDTAPPREGAGILVDHEILLHNGADDHDGFFISPLEKDQVQGHSIDQKIGLVVTKGFESIEQKRRDLWYAFLEMDCGKDVFDEHAAYLERRKKQNGIEYTDTYELHPNECVHVVASEWVRVGRYFRATPGAINERNLQGLIVHCGQEVDAGFNGPMIYLVQNISKVSITLMRGDPLASLALFRLLNPVAHTYEGNRISKTQKLLDRVASSLLKITSLQSNGDSFTRFISDVPGASWTAGDEGKVNSDYFGFVLEAMRGSGDNGATQIAEALDSITFDHSDILQLAAFLEVDKTKAAEAADDLVSNNVTTQLNKIIATLADYQPGVMQEYQSQIILNLTRFAH